MFSCTYNGWADAPEDEREALDAYEALADRIAVCSPEPVRTISSTEIAAAPSSAALRHAA